MKSYYSSEVKKEALRLRAEGQMTVKQIGLKLGVAPQTVDRWWVDHRGSTTTHPTFKIHDDLIKTDLEKYPDALLRERPERLNCSISGISIALRRLKLGRKRRPNK